MNTNSSSDVCPSTCARNPELENQVATWDFSSPAAAISFEERLAREHNWTRGKALEVLAEYRRFLVLTQVSERPVCPSKDVDAAWHLHLTQTRDYRLFCMTVFGRFLHHEPSREGPQEYEKHRAMYVFTLEAYRRHFAQDPPPDIWPSVDERFSLAPPTQASIVGWTVGPVLASAWVRVPLTVGILAALAFASTALALDSLRTFDARVGLVLYASALGMCFIATLGKEPSRKVKRPMVLDAFEAAFLAGGEKRALAAAVAAGVARGDFRIDATRKDKRTITGGQLVRLDTAASNERRDPMEAQVLAATRPGPVAMDELAKAVQPKMDQVARRLAQAGMLTAPRTLCIHPAQLAVLAGIWAVGMALFFASVGGDHRVASTLFAKLLLITALALVVLTAPKQVPSDAGKTAVEFLAKQMARLKTRAAHQPDEGPALPRSVAAVPAAAVAVALFGSEALMADPRYAGYNFLFSGDGQVVTGDSGSQGGCEGGGGCGGCGGCG